MTTEAQQTTERRYRHHRLLYRLEAELEPIMFLLAAVWMWLFVVELWKGLLPWQQNAMLGVWIAFIVEFLLKLYLAPARASYLKHNWITVLALAVPALRAFRMLSALRLLQTTRIASTTRIVRALTSTRRFYRDVQEAQGPEPEPEMNVGVVVVASPAADIDQLQQFAQDMAAAARPEIAEASGLPWTFHLAGTTRLESDDARTPSDFLDTASLAMAEGPYDLVVVVTDVTLASRLHKVQPGLVSSTARIAVISTRKLVSTSRGEPVRTLNTNDVRVNAAALLLQLIGRIAGLKGMHGSEVMQRFSFRESRLSVPAFSASERKTLRRTSDRLPERELHGDARLASLLFHLIMMFRHPGQVFRPLLRNKALLLPLSLPGLATAAIAPSFLLIFTAEIWDVGLGMSNTVAIVYAVLSVIAASLYLARAQRLFLPRKERDVLTEHLAVANVVIFLSILLTCIGLFFMVGLLMLVIEIHIFPADLMQTWPTLDQPEISLADKLRLSAFIATIGVTTGALAGGFESRTLIQNLALFEDES